MNSIRAASQRGVPQTGELDQMKSAIVAVLKLAHPNPLNLHVLKRMVVCSCGSNYPIFEQADLELEQAGRTVVDWGKAGPWEGLRVRLRKRGEPIGLPASPAEWFKPLERRRLTLVHPRGCGEPPDGGAA